MEKFHFWSITPDYKLTEIDFVYKNLVLNEQCREKQNWQKLPFSQLIDPWIVVFPVFMCQQPVKYLV